jgi:FkbM family methyltransferase
MCRRNMSANRIGDVEVHHAAVWTSADGIDFRCEGADAGAIDTLATGVSGTVTRVPSVRLRDVIDSEAAIDLLKVDIEGAEFEVLSDCADVLPRIPAMLIDVHEFDRSQRRMPALLRLLDEAGFVYAIDHLMTLPWRGEADDNEPFPRTATAWACLVRAWRP